MVSEVQDAATTTRPRRRVLRTLLITVLALVIIVPAGLGLFGWWLAGSERGARTVAQQVEKYLPAVKLSGVEGAVTGPLRIAEIRIDMPTRQIVLSQVEVDWDPRTLFDRHLHIRLLHAANLEVVAKDVDSPPLELPQDLHLPLTIAIDRLQIDRAAIAPVALADAVGSASYDGSRYKLDVAQIAVKTQGADPLSGAFKGSATLGATRPFVLDGEIAADAKGALQEQSFGADGTVRLAGSLETLKASVDLTVRQAKAMARAAGSATMQLFAPSPLVEAALKLQGIDLAALRPELPHTRLDADIDLQNLDAGVVAIINHEPGRYDQGRLPIRALRAQVDRRGGGFHFEQLVASLGGAQPAGDITGGGAFANGMLTLDIATRDLDLSKIDGRVRATHLAGNAVIRNAEGRQEFTVSLSDTVKRQRLILDAHALLADAVLAVDRASLKLGSSAIDAKARVALTGTQAFNAEGQIRKFRLRDVGNFSSAPDVLLNGDFSASGTRAPSLSADLAFTIRDSQLAGHPLTGDGSAQVRGNTLNVPQLSLASGANRISMQGALNERDSQLTFAVVAPNLEQLGPGFSGSLNASGTARGTLAQPRIQVEWSAAMVQAPGNVRAETAAGRADVTIDPKQPLYLAQATAEGTVRGLQSGAARAGSIDARLQFSPRPDAPLVLRVDAKNVAGAGRQVDSIVLAIDGTSQRHAIDLALAERNQRWSAHASGGVDDLLHTSSWTGTLERLDGAGTLELKLAADAAITVSRERIDVLHLRLLSNGAAIDVEQFVREPGRLASRGRVDKLELAKVLELAGPIAAIDTDLVIDGQWDVTLGETWAGSVALARQSGDVTVRTGTPVTLGLRTLRADVNATNGRLTLHVLADGQQLGHVEVDADTPLPARGDRFSLAPNAPISGHAVIDVPSIAWIGPLASPSLSTGGQLKGDVALGGTLNNPRFSGKLNGSALRVAWADLGIDLRQGVLDSEFNDTRLVLQRLEFGNANGGTVRASGPIDFAGGTPALQLALTATRYQLLNRSDRKLTVSGDSTVTVAERKLKVTGAFNIDSGSFDIGRTGAPSLSDDVVIVGRESKSETKLAMALDVRIKLGDGIALAGRGLDAMLQGEIRLLNNAGEPLQAQGTLEIAKGTYTAYGQKLAIEQGLLRFTGPLNNPALSILAMRRDRSMEVEAGVSVRGTVLVPRITLVSEPSVPDAEKLSWLVLGRSLSSAGSTDMDALQRAAGLLLTNSAANGVSSQIATAFGLDTLSVGTSKDTVQQRIVTLGKRISSRLYVSYQKGLETASNALLLRYTLSPRLTVEAETGTRSVLSLFYNIAFD